jgi:hypothetical protein
VRAGVPVANRPPLCLPALTVANLPQCDKSATLSGQPGSCLYITLSRGIVYFQSIQTQKTTPKHHNTKTPQRQAQHLAQKKLSFVFNAFALPLHFFSHFSHFTLDYVQSLPHIHKHRGNACP